MRYRHAVLDDVPAIAGVHIASWRTTYRGLLPDAVLQGLSREQRETQWRRQIEVVEGAPERGCVYVADDDRAGVIGFGSAGPDREPGSSFSGEIYTLYLRAPYQRRGVGRRLFEHIARHLLRHGRPSMRVWVLEGNPAQGFYEHLGGVRFGEKELRIDGDRFTEVGYGWSDVSRAIGLLDTTVGDLAD